jgi:hypothetical protein
MIAVMAPSHLLNEGPAYDLKGKRLQLEESSEMTISGIPKTWVVQRKWLERVKFSPTHGD